jgi:hypothetical protein
MVAKAQPLAIELVRRRFDRSDAAKSDVLRHKRTCGTTRSRLYHTAVYRLSGDLLRVPNFFR